MVVPYEKKHNNNFINFIQSLYGEFDECKLQKDKIQYDMSLAIIKRIRVRDARLEECSPIHGNLQSKDFE